MSIAAVDRSLQQAVSDGVVPGIVALAATAEGPCYSGAFGVMGPGDARPMRTDTVFRIASMTKAITATAAMQLVEQGRLGLDQPMKDIAGEIGEALVLTGFDANGKPELRKPTREVTLRHLLTHTSGYSYDLFNASVGRYIAQAGLPSITTCRYDALRAPLVFDPGERWEYGIGIDWVGRIVEIVSGLGLDAYLRRHLFDPLGMRDTGFEPNPDMQSRLVPAAARTPDGIVKIDFDFPSDADFHMGGGGLYSTGPDYLRYTRMFLNGGTLDGARVLKEETVRLMGRNAIGDLDVPPFVSDNPAVALSAELFPGQVAKWGLSFVINTEDIPGCRAANSLAWAGVHNTFFWIDPTRRLTAVLLMQMLPANDPGVLKTLVGYEAALYAALKPA